MPKVQDPDGGGQRTRLPKFWLTELEATLTGAERALS
jgi:hypothetical protein